MGTSTNGQISYGIVFGEDYEFPWDVTRGGDIGDWWIMDVLAFKPSVEVYADTKSGYAEGATQDTGATYWEERCAFLAANPLPVELVNYCASDSPAYIIAVRGSVRTALRGAPTDFDPDNLLVSRQEQDTLLNFCADHGIEHDAEPLWLLSSYWG